MLEEYGRGGSRAASARGLSVTEVVMASACFCACLAPLMTMGRTNQAASHGRLNRMKVADVAELVMDALAAVPAPVAKTLTPTLSPPPPLLLPLFAEAIGNDDYRVLVSAVPEVGGKKHLTYFTVAVEATKLANNAKRYELRRLVCGL
jgi:hypothetical protein